MELTGLSFIGGSRGAREGKVFQAANPQTATNLEPNFYSASSAEIDRAVVAGSEALTTYSQASGKSKAAFLRRAADGLDAHNNELAERAHLETALPVQRLL